MGTRASRHRAPADLEDAIDALGLEVYRTTDDEVTCWCPKHVERLGKQDNRPSWSINRETGLHNCWSCQYRGTFLELVMDTMFPYDVFRAARWLRQFGSNLATASNLATFADREDLDAAIAEIELVPETELAMYGDVPDWALEARQLSRESVDHYKVRWNGERDSWIIPVRTPTGELLGWQEKWAKRKKFMNQPDDMEKSLSLFGYDVFPLGETAMLLESPLDVLRLHTAGYEGGLATYGSSVSKTQLYWLKEATDELIIAMDDDRPGHLIAEELRVGKWDRGKLVSPGIAKHFNLRFFDYGRSGCKDIGDMDTANVTQGVYNAQHYTVARFGDSEQEKARVHRAASRVPGRPRRKNGRQRPLPADSRRGNRKDPNDNRRRRGSA